MEYNKKMTEEKINHIELIKFLVVFACTMKCVREKESDCA